MALQDAPMTTQTNRLRRWWSILQISFFIATAAGVVVHEMAHKSVAEELGIPVHEVCLFRLGQPAGYVIHDQPRSFLTTFAIATAPFIFNSAVAFTAFFAIGWHLTVTVPSPTTLELGGLGLLAWLGVSCGVHAFPSDQDLKNIWVATKRGWWNPVALATLPLTGLLYVLDRARPLGAALLYSGLMAVAAYIALENISRLPA